MFSLRVNRIAAVELADSKSFYNKRQKGLGDTFENVVLAKLESILNNPFTYPTVKNKIRKVVFKRFPFVVLYEIENDVIIILHVFHTSRNPKYWREIE